MQLSVRGHSLDLKWRDGGELLDTRKASFLSWIHNFNPLFDIASSLFTAHLRVAAAPVGHQGP